MKQKSKMQQLKRWYKLAEPSKKYFMITLITACIPAVFYVLEPIASANAITQLTEHNYTGAILWLVVGFCFILFRNVSWHINYWNFERLIGKSYVTISMKIYDKLVGANDESFKNTSKEKIVNIASSDIYTVSNFSDILCTKLSYLFRVIITIIVVFTSSPIAGAIIIAISVMNYFLLNLAGNKIGQYGKSVSEAKDDLFEKMVDVSEARAMIRDHNLTNQTREEYKKAIHPYFKSRYKRTLWNSFVDNWVYVIWQAVVCVTTIYLVYLVSGDSLSLTTYLVIVGYLAPTIEKVNSFSLIFKELSVADVSSGRIQTLLDFSPKELVEYGNRMTNKIEGTISFVDVCVDAKNSYHTENVSDLKKFNLNIQKGELVLFVGPKSCGKRSIFHILRRAIKPDSGKVLLSGVDLYDYSPKVHYKNLAYTTHKPYFLKGTILTNFEMYSKNKRKIKEACQKAGVYEFIESQPNKFNTDVQEFSKWPEKQKYLLGLARALLSDAEVLMIYEFPTQLSMRDRAEVEMLLKTLAGEKTIIVFASQDDMAPVADKVVYISRGEINNIVQK